MTTESPGVIYLEVDEDITSAIDKLTKSAGSRVQVVTAKRSTLFQSVINLKLLHKAAKDANKSLVLVTSDRVATNLAGRLGVAVASQVGEAANVPTAASAALAQSADDEIDGGSIGAPDATANPLTASQEEPSAASEAPPPPTSKPQKASKPRGQRVPNIGKMQKRILWAGIAVLIIVVLFGLDYFLTSANVDLYAKASQVNATFSFTADPTATQSSTSNAVLSAQQLTLTKSLTAAVTATGTKDDGAKASGTMTVNNCYDYSSHTLVAGTRFVAPDGNVFVSTGDVTVPPAVQGGKVGSAQPGTASVGVQASANGSQYNEASATYSIPGLPANEQSTSCSATGGGIYGQGNQMQGGVTKVSKVITQSDLNQAEQSALAADKTTGTQAVEAKANNDQTVLSPSLTQTAGSASSNPSVGTEASTGNAAIQVTYTVLAVQKSALSSLAQAQEGQQLGSQSQIYDDGSSNLHLTAVGAPEASGAQKFKAAATAYAGTKIDTAALAKQLKGQKYSQAVQTASQVPGVSRASITLSPSWSTGLPQISSHIHVQIKVSNPSG